MAPPTLVIEGKRRLRYGGKVKFGWKLVASNGRIIAVDGRQDYNNEIDAENVAGGILNGRYSNFRTKFVRHLPPWRS